MMYPSFSRCLIGAAMATTMLVIPACDPKKESENPEIRDLAQKAAELDKLNQTAQVSEAEQNRKLKAAGVNDVKPNPETLQLSPAQKEALEARIKAEKNSSYQALLQEVLDKDAELKEIHEKMDRLKAVLPRPDVAKDNDSHYGMAMRYLRKRGVREEQARVLISHVLVMDKLAPGFLVYHFYSNGVYGTWVAQGKATMTPTELQTEERVKIEGERDDAQAQATKANEELIDLNAQKEKITADVAALQAEKATMVTELAGLATTGETQRAKLNSLHYVVGGRKDLEAKGIIVVPVFAKDRAGTNWADEVFTGALDLRSQDTLTITAQQLGLKAIGRVSVVPGSLLKDKHYAVTISQDKSSATIKILNKERFRNEKVAFAVSD